MLAFLAMALATSVFYAATAPRALRRVFPLVCLAGILAIPFIPETTLDRFRSIANPGADYNYTSEEGRLAVWKRGAGYALANPFVGVGLDNFGSAEGQSEAGRAMQAQGIGFKWGAAHSLYIQAWAELGLIGGTALIALLLLTIRDLLKVGRVAGRTRDPDALMLGLLGISLVGFAVAGAFLSWAYYPAPYVLFGIAYASLDQLRRPAPAAQRSRVAFRQRRGVRAPQGAYR
jgi:O-antigen ligase